MSRFLFVVALLVGVLTGFRAGADEPQTWYELKDLGKAIDAAKRLGRPIAIMWQIADSKHPGHNARRKELQGLNSLRRILSRIQLKVPEGVGSGS